MRKPGAHSPDRILLSNSERMRWCSARGGIIWAQASCQEMFEHGPEPVRDRLAPMVAPARDELGPVPPDAIDRTRRRCEDPAIEQGIAGACRQAWMARIEAQQIRWQPLGQPGGSTQRLSAAGKRGIEQGPPGGSSFTKGENVAGAQRQALRIFEQP